MEKRLRGSLIVLLTCFLILAGNKLVYADEIKNDEAQIVNEDNNIPAENKTDFGNQMDAMVEKDCEVTQTVISESESDEPQTEVESVEGWSKTDSGEWQYYIENRPVTGEYKIDGYWYYFNENGIMQTGLTVQEGKPDKVYYYEPNGKICYGWKEIEGVEYYFHPVTGVMLKNAERQIDGEWYYFKEDGTRATGLTVQANKPGKQYYYNADGKMQYEWQSIDGVEYYFHPVTGVMLQSAERKIDNSWYYFNKKGAMQTGWVVQDSKPGKWYYYGADGKMKYGFQTINDKKYYFHPVTGVMLQSAERKIDNNWYYFDKNGIMQTGWVIQDGKPDKWYYYGADGKMKYGFQIIDGKKYFFHKITGVMMHNTEYKIDNNWYYFDKNGVMQTGWVIQDGRPGKWYYYGADGKMRYGWQTISGTTYLFDKVTGVMKPYTFRKSDGNWLCYDLKGKQVTDLRSILGSQSSYVIKVNKPCNTVTVYAQYADGTYSVPVVAFICSTGAATPVGTFYTPNKWRWLRMMGPSWGQWVTQVKGDYLFHSVYYNSANNNNNLSVSAYNNLGKQVSHGCIRLTAGDAKWIYDNCELSTKVIIYKDTSSDGPLGKPSAYKLPYWHTWDPTDPNMYYKCRRNGCH